MWSKASLEFALVHRLSMGSQLRRSAFAFLAHHFSLRIKLTNWGIEDFQFIPSHTVDPPALPRRVSENHRGQGSRRVPAFDASQRVVDPVFECVGGYRSAAPLSSWQRGNVTLTRKDEPDQTRQSRRGGVDRGSVRSCGAAHGGWVEIGRAHV